jgi:hypothetical protein
MVSMDSVGDETRSDILYSKLLLGTVIVMILAALKRTTPVFVVVGLSEDAGLAATVLALVSRTRASVEKDILFKIIAVRVEDGSSLGGPQAIYK